MIKLLVGIALFYVLIKIPFWVLGSIKGKPGFVGGLIRGFVAYKTLGLVGGLGRRIRNRTSHSAAAEEGLPDPYAKARTDSRGQYLLPFEGLKRQKLNKPPHQRYAPKPSPARHRRGPDRQMQLPVEGEWPENKAVLQRDGQYRLAMPVERQSRQRPSDPGPEAPTAMGRSRQMSLPLGREWPENRPRWPAPDKHGQYRLPLRVRRQPRPTPPPPAPPPPPPPGGEDQQLSLIELPPQRWPRANRHGQYPLPLDVQRQPRPQPPPIEPPPPRPRRRPHPQLPLQPRPRRSRPRRSSGGHS